MTINVTGYGREILTGGVLFMDYPGEKSFEIFFRAGITNGPFMIHEYTSEVGSSKAPFTIYYSLELELQRIIRPGNEKGEYFLNLGHHPYNPLCSLVRLDEQEMRYKMIEIFNMAVSREIDSVLIGVDEQ